MNGTRNGAGRRIKRNFDTVFNVAQLLQETTGDKRNYRFELEWFALDKDIVARDVEVSVRLLRLANSIMATGEMAGVALIECVRCLEIYDQPFQGIFEQDYRPGGNLFAEPDGEDDDEVLTINELHELDIAEPLRQGIILSLPMQPICREECPGLPEWDDREESGDHRLSVLASLLDESADGVE